MLNHHLLKKSSYTEVWFYGDYRYNRHINLINMPRSLCTWILWGAENASPQVVKSQYATIKWTNLLRVEKVSPSYGLERNFLLALNDAIAPDDIKTPDWLKLSSSVKYHQSQASALSPWLIYYKFSMPCLDGHTLMKFSVRLRGFDRVSYSTESVMLLHQCNLQYQWSTREDWLNKVKFIGILVKGNQSHVGTITVWIMLQLRAS